LKIRGCIALLAQCVYRIPGSFLTVAKKCPDFHVFMERERSEQRCREVARFIFFNGSTEGKTVKGGGLKLKTNLYSCYD
jgi:hypothetical protein